MRERKKKKRKQLPRCDFCVVAFFFIVEAFWEKVLRGVEDMRNNNNEGESRNYEKREKGGLEKKGEKMQ